MRFILSSGVTYVKGDENLIEKDVTLLIVEMRFYYQKHSSWN